MRKPRLLALCALSLSCAALLACAVFKASGEARPQRGGPSGPTIWLQEPQSLPVKHVGAASVAGSRATTGVGRAALTGNDNAAQILTGGQAQPLTLAKGNFHRSGIEDLVVGYAAPGGGILAVHQGNLDAFAPQSDASF